MSKHVDVFVAGGHRLLNGLFLQIGDAALKPWFALALSGLHDRDGDGIQFGLGRTAWHRRKRPGASIDAVGRDAVGVSFDHHIGEGTCGVDRNGSGVPSGRERAAHHRRERPGACIDVVGPDTAHLA